MAKSKSGGTRSYIRGRVGADVYSIGKDGNGKKQQVVRSLAESVANPQTESQMRGRMIMSTVMQALAGLRPIVDHSFDGFSGKQANLSEFIRRNYALIKNDVAVNPTSGNQFGLVKFGEKGAKAGAYVISAGEANFPASLSTSPGGMITMEVSGENATVGDFLSSAGIAVGDYITVVVITASNEVKYARLRVNPEKPKTTALSADCFLIESNGAPLLEVAGGLFSFGFSGNNLCAGFIVSISVNGSYIHNDTVMQLSSENNEFAADVALPTYPQGNADFLNGGNLFGLTEEAGV